MKLPSLAILGIFASAVTALAACDESPFTAPTSRDLDDLQGHGSRREVALDEVPILPPATRAGSALARTPAGDALLLADEDHEVVRAIPLPADVRAPRFELSLPGRPAQVIALSDRVLVTVRDPGALVVLRHDDAGGLYESSRVALPPDAWGLAVTADLETAIVTSAWSHRVSAVDLDTLNVRWTVDVGREPRGVVVTEAGVAYVSHLVGAPITRIDGIDGAAPRAVRVDLPAAPLRAAHGSRLEASLGYAPVLSADESRLFVPRSALGAQREFGWFGTSTVDVLSTKDDSGVAPPRAVTTLRGDGESWSMILASSMSDIDGVVPLDTPTFVQPRAAVYRGSTRTLLVAGEGNNMLAELDARSFDPALAPRRAYPLAKHDTSLAIDDPAPRYVIAGGAPSAIALSADESVAYVFSRSTYDLVIVELDPFDQDAGFDPGPPAYLSLASDPISIEVSKGRKLFYDATDMTVSGGYGCAGCHPDGRDDGHTWHENGGSEASIFGGYRGALSKSSLGTQAAGFARQTPMLAGRVDAQGPYGWRGESPNLETRLLHGFSLHRWGGSMDASFVVAGERPKAIAAFLRKGLASPPSIARELSSVELAGKAIFERPSVGCATCHASNSGFTDRSPAVVPRGEHPAFDDEGSVPFKTPSLLFVGSTPPYFHDGATGTLEALIDRNGRAMGDTTALGPEARSSLVAYLRTIGGFSDAPAELPFVKATRGSAPRAPVALPKRPRRWAPPEVARVGDERTGKEPCHVQRIDDYAYFACDPFRAGSIELLAGSARGFDAWTVDGAARATFPLVRGERRLLQATRIEMDGWGGGVSASSAGLVEVDWPVDADEPTILVR